MATEQSNVPATAVSSYFNRYNTVLVIGSNTFWPTPSSQQPFYWFVVVDLTSLKVVQNVTSTSNSAVPAQVVPYLGNAQYFLYFCSNSQMGANIPQGALATFLMQIGAGAQYQTMEQTIGQLGTGMVPFFSYVLAATMATADLPGFEAFSTFDPSILTMAFMPVTVDGKTIYAPIQTTAPSQA